MTNTLRIAGALSLLGLLAACRPAATVPKPKGYYRIDLPEHAYHSFDSTGFPYRFDYPVYGHISQDQALSKAEHQPYWLNIDFPELNATIYLSYKAVTAAEPIGKLVDESYRLSQAHDIRADYIKTPAFRTKHGLIGVFYAVGGNAASAYQFFITDSSRHFLRGSLYFDNTPNADSLRPASEFLKKDMEYLVESLQFK